MALRKQKGLRKGLEKASQKAVCLLACIEWAASTHAAQEEPHAAPIAWSQEGNATPLEWHLLEKQHFRHLTQAAALDLYRNQSTKGSVVDVVGGLT